jgi:3-oxoacyl-[acyl-carrier-protein] synthase II
MFIMKTLVTGLGCISAAGKNLKETLASFQDARVNARTVSIFKTLLNSPVFEVGLTKEYIAENKMRTLVLAEHAVNEAFEDAGLNSDILSRFRVGVSIGTTVASQLNDHEYYRSYRESGNGSVKTIDRYLNGNLATILREKYDLNGPGLTVVNACSSGTDAIGAALSWLKSGICDIVIAGGADELNPIPYSGFNSLGITSEVCCRPFDKNRAGLNLGEGAGIIVLETEDVAKKRGIKPKLTLSGYGTYADAYHLTAPRPCGSGLISAIRYAAKEAEININNVSFVNAHGTATFDNDKVEGCVFKELFNKNIKFLSTKGYTGHTLGAAGGLEAVFTCAALNNEWIPKSVGFEVLDDDIGLAPITEKTDIAGSVAISTSLAFGGNNSALVFEKISL